MSNVSEHLHAFHKAMHEDRKRAIANHEAQLDKADGKEEFHKAEIERHKLALQHHADGMQECSKALAAEDLAKFNPDQLVPTRVSAIAPPPEVRAIPRAGQRLPAAADPSTDALFEKIFGLQSTHVEERSLSK